jgi:hypothetical protein
MKEHRSEKFISFSTIMNSLLKLGNLFIAMVDFFVLSPDLLLVLIEVYQYCGLIDCIFQVQLWQPMDSVFDCVIVLYFVSIYH